MNVCSFGKTLGIDLFIKPILDKFKGSIDFKLECPFKAGYLTIRGFENNYGMAANFFPLHETNRYTLTLRTKVGKKIVNFYIFTVDFEIVEAN